MCIALNCKTMLLKCRCRNGNLTVRLETTVVWFRSTAESSFSNYSETINLANLRIMYELWDGSVRMLVFYGMEENIIYVC